MTDVKGLPAHHRAYIYARAAVLAEDTGTDALDALVRRGFTDAEELRMRDRRYLADPCDDAVTPRRRSPSSVPPVRSVNP